MKLILLCIIGLVLLLITSGCSCSSQKQRGGTEVTPDKNAPTKIESTELISLDCNASTSSMVGVEEKGLEYGRYYFKCQLDTETGKVTGTYGFKPIHDYSSDVTDYSFETDSSFLTDLDTIIKNSSIIYYNGEHRHTNGIPNEFGYSLNAEYASGEVIDCSDNQSNHLSLDTLKDLDNLFLSICKTTS